MKRKKGSEGYLQMKRKAIKEGTKNPSAFLAHKDWQIIRMCIFGYLKTEFPSKNFQYGNFNELSLAFAESQNEPIKNNHHFRNWVARLYISFEHPIIHKRSPFIKVSTGDSPVKKKKKKSGAHSEYVAYINSIAWKQKREEAFAHHGRKCSKCPMETNLHVHHITYDNLFNEKMDDLSILCKTCHQKEHGRKFK